MKDNILNWIETADEKPKFTPFLVQPKSLNGVHPVYDLQTIKSWENYPRWAYFNLPISPVDRAWRQFAKELGSTSNEVVERAYRAGYSEAERRNK